VIIFVFDTNLVFVRWNF